MDVILDTNIYVALLRRQGRNVFSSNAFVELFTYLRRTKSNLILPGPVFHELIKEYSDLISDSIKKAQDSWTTLQRNAISKLTDRLPPKRDAEVEAFQEELLSAGIGFEVVVLEDYEDIALAEVVRRGVNRIRPASDNGEELRDVVIWLFALSHAKAKSSKIAFITDDGHFKGPDEDLHPDLAKDVASQKVELLYYDSIPKFIRANSLERSVVLADEIALMVHEGVIADLVTERFKRAKFEDVTISEIQFQDAQKYKVADDAFYIEANCTTVVRYSEITTPPNPVWLSPTPLVINESRPFDPIQSTPQFNPVTFTGIQVGIFSGLGAKVPLSAMAATTVRKNYEAVVALVLSFRVVSNATQSVEILNIEINKNAQLSDGLVTR
jgi:PIN domain